MVLTGDKHSKQTTMTKQIYKFDPDQVWFTSDTHFGHENIIRFCGRPFRDVEEMNAKTYSQEEWDALRFLPYYKNVDFLKPSIFQQGYQGISKAVLQKSSVHGLSYIETAKIEKKSQSEDWLLGA